MRLDAYLTEKGLVKSRERAKELILNGGVLLNGKTAARPSAQTDGTDLVEIVGKQLEYVGRGGLKLEKALEIFGISPKGRICADLGASTGGFTHCLLKNGAKKVYAVDVGHGQLDELLRNDPAVVNMEGTDIRTLTEKDIGGRSSLICCDVSFISLKHILPVIAKLLSEDGEAVILIKPQFECGRSDVGKGGIVRSERVHERVVSDIVSEACADGLAVDSLGYSPVCGGDGNIEYLARLRHNMTENGNIPFIDIRKTVSEAFSELSRKGKHNR